MLLSEDGRHVWLGRATDPTDEEVALLEAQLGQSRLGGWITVLEGHYWGDGDLRLLEVRKLGKPGRGWEQAVAEFLRLRDEAKKQ